MAATLPAAAEKEAPAQLSDACVRGVACRSGGEELRAGVEVKSCVRGYVARADRFESHPEPTAMACCWMHAAEL